jgi:hypothetical protein
MTLVNDRDLLSEIGLLFFDAMSVRCESSSYAKRCIRAVESRQEGMVAASNSRDCFKECVGKKVTGVLFDAFPIRRIDLSSGSKTLIFDDGSGLTVASNGSFWTETAKDVKWAVDARIRELSDVKTEIAAALSVAGLTVD